MTPTTGGLFRVTPEGDGWISRQLYLPDTNVLITRLLTPGVGEVQDFMVSPRTGEAARRRRMIRRVEFRAGQAATFVLDRLEPGEVPVPCSDAGIAAGFDAAVAFWRGWLRRSRYGGRWREMVHRSALTLKLLT